MAKRPEYPPRTEDPLSFLMKITEPLEVEINYVPDNKSLERAIEVATKAIEKILKESS